MNCSATSDQHGYPSDSEIHRNYLFRPGEIEWDFLKKTTPTSTHNVHKQETICPIDFLRSQVSKKNLNLLLTCEKYEESYLMQIAFSSGF